MTGTGKEVGRFDCEAGNSCVAGQGAEGTLVRVIAIDDLLTALEGDPRDALESFLARALHDGGVWPSPRMSDGVASYRVVNRTRVRASVCGKIWSVDQTLHAFWLDVECGDAVTWVLYFDADTTMLSAPRARNFLDTIQDPAEAPWVHTLKCGEPKACA